MNLSNNALAVLINAAEFRLRFYTEQTARDASDEDALADYMNDRVRLEAAVEALKAEKAERARLRE